MSDKSKFQAFVAFCDALAEADPQEAAYKELRDAAVEETQQIRNALSGALMILKNSKPKKDLPALWNRQVETESKLASLLDGGA